VARREADLAVRVLLGRSTDSSLICRKLGDLGSTLYASRDYLAQHGVPHRGQGLGGYDVIIPMSAPSSLRWGFFMGESLVGARVALRTNDQFAQRRATAEGIGISELACFFGDEHPRLVRLWPQEPPTLRPLLLITHEDLRRSTRIRVVSSALVEAFKREARVLRYGSAVVQAKR